MQMYPIKLHRRLASKLIFAVGMIFLVSISVWAFFNIQSQKEKVMADIVKSTDRLTTTIRLGTHYAMMLNSRNDINQIIQNIGKQKEIDLVRIYDKTGRIVYSSRADEVNRMAGLKEAACVICHRVDPPISDPGLTERIRIFSSDQGFRLLGITSAICNEESCATAPCHFHPQGKKILGALDVVISLAETDQEIRQAEKGMVGLASFLFIVTSAMIFFIVFRFVTHPIKRLIDRTRAISKGDYNSGAAINQKDELGQLALEIGQMGAEIGKNQAALAEQKAEYQNLFEQVPCFITVQDRNYRLIRYNHEFAKKFDPTPGDFCYHAYKGRSEKCVPCLVEKTLEDGAVYYGEEAGVYKDGTPAHWIVRTSPVKNRDGEIVSAMEMSLDITHRKQLEDKLEISENKYRASFNNIPNPVFVLDISTLDIVDCNDSVTTVYGFHKNELMGTSFLSLFKDTENRVLAEQIQSKVSMDKIKHRHKSGKTIFVNLRISPSWYPERQVLLVTTSDVTRRLETEQQLNQASKMATLGEMATGMAHELNQPLSVIKTASSFFLKKLDNAEALDANTLSIMLRKIDSNVDRASDIINHMRQFARKPDLTLAKVQVNHVLKRAYDIFSQQLRLREIKVEFDLQSDLPLVKAEAGRLEQVFINLLLNARDAIEEKWASRAYGPEDKIIVLKTHADKSHVIIEVRDTGTGIPEEIEGKLFEPFFTTKEVGKGTGLGLSISYGIVKECGGGIQGVNHENGASFIVTFPRV